ncbi:sigma-70 family RNA polymerase sigma factor [Fructilactobacillus myrtifloralis]|uniref:Sigma-70 family RNA polymerase sigma factor n=1 Tax=Fructilactobacillus myrtifloralis TaxID=2940301 RepID=A0ABY5BML2_9LACO|nr:sigma-70 family RNA polymerase sigma factor [Fructilactobacillus myrtifloralis]USS84912.1 sigma-70 family RNA polymerase sigma factor [Fructilactobacillus myrtifloralis]
MGSKLSYQFDSATLQAAKTNEEHFVQLFHQFAPVYLKLWHDFYLRDMDLNDWSQEAAVVFIRTLHRYDVTKRVTFGSFYKTNLRNHLFDLLRKKNAQKRIPERLQASFSACPDYYAETIQDEAAPNPLKCCELTERLQQVGATCSAFERQVLSASLRQQTVAQIARRFSVDEQQVQNALVRCKRKYHQLKN